MPFMQLWISKKGSLYSCDCSRCGTTNYSHEWVDDVVRNQASEWQNAGCWECGRAMDLTTFAYCGKHYAGRYSAPGYMDCTEWSYDSNKARLARELRAMYA